MAFLRSALPEDYVEPISGAQLMLRAPAWSDYAAWAELRALSRAHLTPWEPVWSRDELSRSFYRRRLRGYAHDARDDLGYSYFIASPDGAKIFGGLTLANIRRGAAQTAAIGYWIGAPYAGQGKMQEALRLLLPFAFLKLRLHRLEAASMPANAVSRHVLEKAGFKREGLAARYLKINGRWEDHVIYALIEEDLAAGRGIGEER